MRRRPGSRKAPNWRECRDVSLLAHGSRRLRPPASSKGTVLPRGHALLPRHHDACHDTESHLRHDEPEPVNPLVQHGNDDVENAMDQTGPQDGRDHAPKYNRMARQHRKRYAVQEPDERRSDQVYCRGDEERIPMKSIDLFRSDSRGEKSRRQKVDRIPDAVLANDSVS